MKNETLAERFWSKANKGPDSECWLWQGSRRGYGYGVFHFKGKTRPAHRVAWELHNGKPFPDGKFGCHSCDNPSCVNPHHIWPGTLSENSRDAYRKGRIRTPTQNPEFKTHNTYKTHCPKGHPYAGENLRVSPSGSRYCRQCNKDYLKINRAKYKKDRP